MTSTQDIYAFGLAMLSEALDARTEVEAKAAALAVIEDQPAEVARMVATLLAVETVWRSKPRRSRRAFREWVELRKFQAMTSDVRSGS